MSTITPIFFIEVRALLVYAPRRFISLPFHFKYDLLYDTDICKRKRERRWGKHRERRVIPVIRLILSPSVSHLKLCEIFFIAMFLHERMKKIILQRGHATFI